MPLHDWMRVDAGIFHSFHHSWIEEIHRAVLKRLPADYYCLAEQQAADFGPDVLTLKSADADEMPEGGTATRTRPKTSMFQETATEFYLRKKKAVVIRHVRGDRIVAMIEIVSPGNKNSTAGPRAFVRKARELLQQRVHLLIVDPFPVGQRDPQGLRLPSDKPMSVFAYECDESVRTYLEPLAFGDAIPDMPVFLYPGMFIEVPLETAYRSAWEAVPVRWQKVIESPQTPA